MEALKYKPVAYWPLDGVSPYQDCSGYGRSATLTGTQRNGISIHSESTRSLVVDGSNTLKVDSPVFRTNHSQPFALEATVVPIARSKGINAQTFYENKILNPKPTNGTYWTSSNNVVHPRTFVTAQDNRPAIRITRGEVSALAIYCARSASFPSPIVEAKGGETFTLVFKAMANVESTIQVQIGQGTSTASVANITQEITLYTTPRIYKLTFTLPTTGNTIGQQIFPKFFSQTGAGAIGDWYQFWDIGWYDAPYSEQYFDGDMAGFKWRGEANLSNSISRDDVADVNIVHNPTFGSSNNMGNQNGSMGRTNVGVPPLFGEYFAKATRTQTGVGQNRAMIAITSYATPPARNNYTASAWVYTENARSIKLEVNRPYITTGSSFASSPTFSVPAGVWTRIWFNLSLDGFRGAERLQLVGENFNEGEAMYVDGYQLSYNNRPYFDGSMDEGAWTGAADNSPSTLRVSSGPQAILSNSNVADGLTINGSVVSFSTAHSDGTFSMCSYDIGDLKKVHLVGQFTTAKNSLFVNGEMVAEVDNPQVPLVATDNLLYSGQSGSSRALLINNLGVYSHTLGDEEVKRLFRAAIYTQGTDIPEQFDGEYINLDNYVIEPNVVAEFSDEEDWNVGQHTGTIVLDDELVPGVVAGTTVAATWTASISLDVLHNSARFDWEGTGFIVERSLDGTNWVPVEKNLPFAVTPDDNAQVLTRVTFISGLAEAYLSYLKFEAKVATETISHGIKVIAPSPTAALDRFEPFEFDQFWGLRTPDDGRVRVLPDTTETDVLKVRTVEVWLKRDTDTEVALVNANTGAAINPTAVYTNGVLENTYPIGQWVVKHYVSSSDISFTALPLAISGAKQIGRVAFYSTNLSQATITNIIQAYTGSLKTRIADTSTVSVTEPAQSVITYGYDWDIVSA